MPKLLPIAVDLDGTLTPSDLLVEHMMLILKRQPWMILAFPLWLLRGRLYFKNKIAELSPTNPQIPFRGELIEYLKIEKRRGRPVYLVTASPQLWADQIIAGHENLFDGAWGTDGRVNLKGAAKAKLLTERLGAQSFIYVGDSLADWPVYQAAGAALPIGKKTYIDRVTESFQVETQFLHPVAGWKTWAKAIRVHQWAKNSLVFLPMFLAHRLDLQSFMASVFAFFSLSFMASSIYIVNDLLDLESDRQHPKKSSRAFASGALSPLTGLLISMLCLLVSVLISLLLPWEFAAVLLTYFVITNFYSFSLKSKLLLDVVTLAGLFTLRIFAGSAATGIAISEWLLAFSIFIFFSLAMLKRYIEILRLKEHGKESLLGRAYQVNDQGMISATGVASGFMAALVLTIYLNQAAAANLYTHPQWLLGVTVLMMYWISRIWILSHRGQVHDDPIVFALRDRQSLIVGILAVILMWAAST